MQQQIPLGFKFNNETSFDSFVVGDNKEALTAIRNLMQDDGEHCIYIWGAKGVGKSHLMQSVCQEFTSRRNAVAYLGLKDRVQYSPEILNGLETLSLVCIDDVQEITGDPAWLISGSLAPAQLDLKLADLKSRLGWGLTLQIKPLNDMQKLAVLQKRAMLRGMELNDESGQFLLKRYSRDMDDLLRLLDILDKASLSEQRRLTIPFIRDYI